METLHSLHCKPVKVASAKLKQTKLRKSKKIAENQQKNCMAKLTDFEMTELSLQLSLNITNQISYSRMD